MLIYHIMAIKSSFGQRVKKSRLVLNYTQKDLASAIGVTPQHISFIEQERGAPSLELLPKIAEELGVSVDYLLSGKASVATDLIPAIKADKRLKIITKKALIALVEGLYSNNSES
jgi:transcriptional regulator with XRE-family HTH domain